MQLCYGRKQHVSTRDEINYEGYAGPDISNIVKNVSMLRYIKLEEEATSQCWGSGKARVIEIILFLDYSRISLRLIRT